MEVPLALVVLCFFVLDSSAMVVVFRGWRLLLLVIAQSLRELSMRAKGNKVLPMPRLPIYYTINLSDYETTSASA